MMEKQLVRIPLRDISNTTAWSGESPKSPNLPKSTNENGNTGTSDVKITLHSSEALSKNIIPFTDTFNAKAWSGEGRKSPKLQNSTNENVNGGNPDIKFTLNSSDALSKNILPYTDIGNAKARSEEDGKSPKLQNSTNENFTSGISDMKITLNSSEALSKNMITFTDIGNAKAWSGEGCKSPKLPNSTNENVNGGISDSKIKLKSSEASFTKTINCENKTGEEVFSCKFCSKKMTRMDNLKLHEKSHTKENLHHCKYCKKSFTRKYRLVNHERVHTGEKPFNCNNCDKSFKQESHLQKHEGIHAG